MDCKKAQSLVTSYITRKLNDKELEEFLEHIDTCDECYEELEIYYTVHYTLARLDKDETGQKSVAEPTGRKPLLCMENESFPDLSHGNHDAGRDASGAYSDGTGGSVAVWNDRTQSDQSVFIHAQ